LTGFLGGSNIPPPGGPGKPDYPGKG
jgi:hypothetical protein